jgi:NitT/TauT family transport system substrate-binding protein
MKRNAVIVILVASLFVACGGKAQTKDLVIKIPLVTWGGYAALFAANGGAKANTNSLFYKYGKFQVELVQEENPANQLQGFANGTYQIIWSTMDMLPLSYDSLSKDKRTIPQVIGLFDLSSGGDGIIVRGNIKTAKDLKGKKIVVAQYTPSHFFILWTLDQAGLTQKDVQMVYAADAISAKDTFIADKTIDVCVTWSPFIYDITDPRKDTFVKGSRLLATSAKGQPAHGLIADIWFARTDLVKSHPEVIEAFSKAYVDGYAAFQKDVTNTAREMAEFFGIKGGAADMLSMYNDVVIAGPKENATFFDKKDKFSAWNIFNTSAALYIKNGGNLATNFNVDPSAVIFEGPMLKAVSGK